VGEKRDVHPALCSGDGLYEIDKKTIFLINKKIAIEKNEIRMV